jgi:alkanesulfonate monooxygenase SsuD/methylene tetrahydromethanopterin reductase-like flavin-dependent oxidoreductase (luciferase family)
MGEDIRPGVPATPAELIAFARDVEAAGFDSVWTFDHLLSYEDGVPAGTWEAWTLLTAIAAATARVGLGVLVSCTGFREPVVTAKIAYTLQEISGGRLTLGLGAGWHEPEYTAFGLPFDHRVDRFAEQLRIIGGLLRDGRSDFAGRYHRTVDAPMLPRVDRAPMPFLIGGRGPRMLDLTARHADIWNTAWYGLPGPKFDEIRARMAAAEEAAGRKVEVSVGIYVKADGEGGPGLHADGSALREAIAAWRGTGVDEILFWTNPATRARFDILAGALR